MAESCAYFQKISFDRLNGRQKELFNFQKIAATLAEYGFNCIKLSDDWQGADFLAYHFNGDTTLKVQLKSRLTIARKYCGKDLWIAFPYRDSWYLVRHDYLVKKIEACTNWLDSSSWKDHHLYSSASVNKKLLDSLAEDRLGPVYGAISS